MIKIYESAESDRDLEDKFLKAYYNLQGYIWEENQAKSNDAGDLLNDYFYQGFREAEEDYYDLLSQIIILVDSGYQASDKTNEIINFVKSTDDTEIPFD